MKVYLVDDEKIKNPNCTADYRRSRNRIIIKADFYSADRRWRCALGYHDVFNNQVHNNQEKHGIYSYAGIDNMFYGRV